MSKTVTRSRMFETNSSSAHTFIIDTFANTSKFDKHAYFSLSEFVDNDCVLGRTLKIRIRSYGEYNSEVINTAYSKLCYLFTLNYMLFNEVYDYSNASGYELWSGNDHSLYENRIRQRDLMNLINSRLLIWNVGIPHNWDDSLICWNDLYELYMFVITIGRERNLFDTVQIVDHSDGWISIDDINHILTLQSFAQHYRINSWSEFINDARYILDVNTNHIDVGDRWFEDEMYKDRYHEVEV